MLSRLVKCLKAWGAGVSVMGLPLLFLEPACVLGKNLWQIPVLLFSILFPALLLFDFLSRKYFLRTAHRRLLLLAALLGMAEFEFYMLPFKVNQVKIEFTLVPLLLIALFTCLAALLLMQIIGKRESLVIVQKEI